MIRIPLLTNESIVRLPSRHGALGLNRRREQQSKNNGRCNAACQQAANDHSALEATPGECWAHCGMDRKGLRRMMVSLPSQLFGRARIEEGEKRMIKPERSECRARECEGTRLERAWETWPRTNEGQWAQLISGKWRYPDRCVLA
jgi:hypothetical protein